MNDSDEKNETKVKNKRTKKKKKRKNRNEEERKGRKDKENESRHKLEMFRVNGIETISINPKGNNKLNYYKNIIQKIKNSR